MNALLLFAALAIEPPSITLDIRGDQGITGTAVMAQSLQTDGTKLLTARMVVQADGVATREILTEAVYARDGSPVRTLQTIREAGETLVSVRIGFVLGTAWVTLEQNGSKREARVEPPAEAKTQAIHEFWFLRDVPEVGQRWTYHHFDVDTLAWAETEARYLGRDSLELGDQTVSAHLLIVGGANVWVDDRGDPYRIERGPILMQRTAAPVE